MNRQGYSTMGNHILLGRVSLYVRKRAKRAGLVPITRRQYHKLFLSMDAIHRLALEGYWFDTVKYP